MINIEKTKKVSGLNFREINNNSKRAICFLHGYGASMDDLFSLGQHMNLKDSYDWFFPNAPMDVAIGPQMSGRAWFPVDMEELNRAMQTGSFRSFETMDAPEFESSLEHMSLFLNELFSNYDEVILGGFSQGAMISTHLSLKFSDKIKGLICFSGTLIKQTELVMSLETSVKFPFIQSHGKSDPVLGYGQAKSLFELLKLGGHEGEFIPFDGGHEIPQNVLNKVQKFIDRI